MDTFLSSVSDGKNAITIEFGDRTKHKLRVWFNREPIDPLDLFDYLYKLEDTLDFDSIIIAQYIDTLTENRKFKFRSK